MMAAAEEPAEMDCGCSSVSSEGETGATGEASRFVGAEEQGTQYHTIKKGFIWFLFQIEEEPFL